MRKFNEFEKEILTKIVNNETFVANFIDKYLSGIRIRVDKKSETVSFLFDVFDKMNVTQEESEQLIERVRKIDGFIISIIDLLNFSEKKQDWIQVVQNLSIEKDVITFGQGISYKNGNTNEDYVSYYMTDSNLTKEFIRYCSNSILPKAELIYFVSSGFVTEEEINYQKEEVAQQKNHEISLVNSKATIENLKLAKRNTTISYISLFVLVLTILVNVMISFYGSVTLNKKQIKDVLTKFDKISYSIDSLKSKDDTINAHVFSKKDSVIIKINNK